MFLQEHARLGSEALEAVRLREPRQFDRHFITHLVLEVRVDGFPHLLVNELDQPPEPFTCRLQHRCRYVLPPVVGLNFLERWLSRNRPGALPRSAPAHARFPKLRRGPAIARSPSARWPGSGARSARPAAA